jgi:hypothetical protein
MVGILGLIAGGANLFSKPIVNISGQPNFTATKQGPSNWERTRPDQSSYTSFREADPVHDIIHIQ